jgi:hypothetical protein
MRVHSKLKAWIVVLFLCVTVSACSVFSPFNRGDAIESMLLDFATPECRLPCFQGITPSITTFEQAAEIAGFAGDTLTIPVMMDFRTEQGIPIEVEIRTSLPLPLDVPAIDASPVSQVTLSAPFQNRILSLGDLVNAGYEPQIAYRRGVGGPNSIGLLLVLGEEEQMLAFVSDVDEISADSPVNRIVLLSPQSKIWVREDFRTIEGYDYRIEWIGYASADDYMSQAILDE